LLHIIRHHFQFNRALYDGIKVVITDIFLEFPGTGLKNETYHLLNPHRLAMTEMAVFLSELGYRLNHVKQDDVQDYLSKFEGNSEYEKIIERLKLHTEIFDEEVGTHTAAKLDRTVALLKKLGFEWPKATKQLIQKMVDYCKEVGFI
jgi:surfactin family lipopeptide synthetase A